MAKKAQKKVQRGGFAKLGSMADDALIALRGKIDSLLRGRLDSAEKGIAQMRAMLSGGEGAASVASGGARTGRKAGKRGGGRGRRAQGGSVRSRALLYLSGREEASVDDIAGTLKLDAGQRRGLGVVLSVAKKDGLLAAGSARGFWKITAKGKEATKDIKTAD